MSFSRFAAPTLAALAAVTLWGAPSLALAGQYSIVIGEGETSVTGKPQRVMTLNGQSPGPVLRLKEGEMAEISVTNTLSEDTSIHWHGLELPYQQDGVPGFSFQGIKPGETLTYRFPVVQSGTYWYHSHSGLQEQAGMLAPIVIEPKDPDPIKADQDLVVVLSDFHPDDPNDILANLKKDSGYYNTNFRRTLGTLVEDAQKSGWTAALKDRFEWGAMRMAPTDLSDISGYTFLINGQAPNQPWQSVFKKGETLRLRFINGAAMSYFDVRIPGLKLTVVAADGNPVKPVSVDEFRMAVGETYDVLVTPDTEQPYTIFAEAMDRSGYARATLTPRAGENGPVPALRPRPQLTMTDMGMAHEGMDHSVLSKDGEMDHSAMMDQGTMDHSVLSKDGEMDHSAMMDHSKMDHSVLSKDGAMDHSAMMDHSKMDHSVLSKDGTMDHAAMMDHSTMDHSVLSKDGAMDHSAMMDHSKMDHSVLSKDGAMDHSAMSKDGTMDHSAMPKDGTMDHSVLSKDGAMDHSAMMDHSKMDHSVLSKDSAMDHSAMMDHSTMDHSAMPSSPSSSAKIVDADPPASSGLAPSAANGGRMLQYADLLPLKPHPLTAPDRSITVRLGGNMERYYWTMDGKKFNDAEPMLFTQGERIRVTLVNETMMNHPIHLHGMWFQVVRNDGQPGPLKHVLNVPPGQSATLDILADAVGQWPFHCHFMYHMATGMMRRVIVAPADGSAPPLPPVAPYGDHSSHSGGSHG